MEMHSIPVHYLYKSCEHTLLSKIFFSSLFRRTALQALAARKHKGELTVVSLRAILGIVYNFT